MKIMFLTFSDDLIDAWSIRQFEKTKNVRQYSVLRRHNFFLRVLRRIHLLSNLPFKYIWFGPWRKKINDTDMIICVASIYSDAVLTWIKRKSSGIRLINYYWDSIDISKYPVLNRDYYENWSFSKNDSIKFNMKYNPQFYLKDCSMQSRNKEYDVSFVGSDRQGRWKKRAKLVNDYYSLFVSLGLNSFFYFVSSENISHKEIVRNRLISTEEYYEICSRSKAIVEIIDPENEWITLRPLWALSNGIKLITNNRSIINELFYSKENVFILEVDDIGKIRQFLDSEFEPISSKVLEYYELDKWIERFMEG